jgi:Fe-S-cluster containining protein
VVAWHVPTLRRIFLWWQRQVNGFELVQRDVGSRTVVFRCTHFDWTSRSCDSYASRPGICRDYPRALLWQPTPEMLPGCGYRPVSPRADQLRTALERHPLSEEQKARLRKGLFLDR